MSGQALVAPTSRVLPSSQQVLYGSARVGFLNISRCFSSANSQRLILGSPSAERLRPGQPGYDLFKQSALNSSALMEKFVKPIVPKSATEQSISPATGLSDDQLCYIVPSKFMQNIFKEIQDLKAKVSLLEGRINKT